MDLKKNHLGMICISLFFSVLAVIGIVWCIASGLLFSGVDGILLVIICLMMAAIFALQIFLSALELGWVKLPGKKADAATKPAAAK